MAELNITGIYFFMPVFSFLLVFIIVYAVLAKTKVLGESKFVNLLIGFIMAIVFMSFSTANFSTEQYVRTIVPWFVVLFVCVFLVLLIAGLSTKDLGKIMTTKFAWVVIAVLIIIFLVAAIRVFNPIFHPEYGITSGESPQVISQIREFFSNGIGGGLLLLVIGIVIAWILTRKWAS